MIACAREADPSRSPPSIQAAFVAMLPTIQRFAAATLRCVSSGDRQEAIQEVVANCWVAYVRLVERGRAASGYPTTLARFAVAQYHDGRRVGNRRRVRDVLSEYGRRQRRFLVQQLDRCDPHTGEWQEPLLDDRRPLPADQAAFRCDFAAWMERLSVRRRQIATSLAVGNTTGQVAEQFCLSAGRVSQLRREFERSWRTFLRQ